MKYLYEQDYVPYGWPDDGGGSMTTFSWFDHDVAGDKIIPLYIVEPGFFISDDDKFFPVPALTTEVFPEFFIDQDVFYHPMTIRALKQPVQMLRNEIRRVR